MLPGYGDAGNPAVIESGTKVSVQYAEDGGLSGSGWCNNFSDSCKLTDKEIEIGPLGSTMIACGL